MLLAQLKQQTRIHHEQLERDIGIERALRDRSSYRRLIERFYGWYRPWEEVSLQRSSGDLRDFLYSRRKLPLLERDLDALGATCIEIGEITSASVPDVNSEAEILGVAYVIEGSTLGGQIISRMIEQQLGMRDGHGYSFYRSYGEHVGDMWRSFRTYAESAVAAEQAPEAVRAAKSAFVSLHDWLCPPR